MKFHNTHHLTLHIGCILDISHPGACDDWPTCQHHYRLRLRSSKHRPSWWPQPSPEPMSVALMWPELPRCYRSHNHPPYCRHLPGVTAGPVSANQRPEMGHNGPIRGWHHRLHTWHLTRPASGHHVTSWKVEMWKVMQMSWSSVPWMSIDQQHQMKIICSAYYYPKTHILTHALKLTFNKVC